MNRLPGEIGARKCPGNAPLMPDYARERARPKWPFAPIAVNSGHALPPCENPRGDRFLHRRDVSAAADPLRASSGCCGTPSEPSNAAIRSPSTPSCCCRITCTASGPRPPDDCDYPTRWMLIKSYFTRRCARPRSNPPAPPPWTVNACSPSGNNATGSTKSATAGISNATATTSTTTRSSTAT
jgi:hypothetical protein